MKKWQIFEQKSCEFLNQNYSSKDVYFKKVGGSNSTLSDIKVIKNNSVIFFMESKMSGAQCGQFVLLDYKDRFIYSTRNKSQENRYSKKLLDYINNNYITFKNVSTKPIEININKDISYDWVIDYYKSKNARFVITGNSLNNFIIFPLNKFSEYFNITANFRVKKSGSRSLSKKHSTTIYELINSRYNCSNLYYSGKKAFIEIYDQMTDKTIFESEQYDFLLKKNKNNIYEIRMLSNTFNANVIFSCILKTEQDEKDLINFKNHVN